MGGSPHFPQRQTRARSRIGLARGTTHTYVNTSETDARMIAVYTPAGMEGLVSRGCTPVIDGSAPPPPVTPELIERMVAAGPRFNIEWVQ